MKFIILLLILVSCRGVYVSEENIKLEKKYIELRTPEQVIKVTIGETKFVSRWFLIKFMRNEVVSEESVIYIVEYIRDSDEQVYANPINERSPKLLKQLENLRKIYEAKPN